MIMMFLQYQFAGIWPLLWHFGLGGILFLGCIALAYFSPWPTLKKDFLWTAALIAVIIISTAIGVTIGERRINAQWDVAKANAVTVGNQAHASAVQSVARKSSRWLRNKRDPDLRD